MLPINECVQLIMEPPELKACSEIIHAAVHTLQRCRKTLKFFFFVVVISSISIHNSRTLFEFIQAVEYVSNAFIDEIGSVSLSMSLLCRYHYHPHSSLKIYASFVISVSQIALLFVYTHATPSPLLVHEASTSASLCSLPMIA